MPFAFSFLSEYWKTRRSLQRETRLRATYSCPCENIGERRISPALKFFPKKCNLFEGLALRFVDCEAEGEPHRELGSDEGVSGVKVLIGRFQLQGG